MSTRLSWPRPSAGVLVLPWVYLLVAGLFCEGLRRQPHIVLARSPDRFAAEIEAAGGAGPVGVGLVLDLVIIGAFLVVTATMLHRMSARWWLPIIPAALDLAENGLLAVAMEREVTGSTTLALAVLAILKFAAYITVTGYLIMRLIPGRLGTAGTG